MLFSKECLLNNQKCLKFNKLCATNCALQNFVFNLCMSSSDIDRKIDDIFAKKEADIMTV